MADKIEKHLHRITHLKGVINLIKLHWSGPNFLGRFCPKRSRLMMNGVRFQNIKNPIFLEQAN